MVSKDTNRTLMRWGFFLLLCALVTGLAVPGFTNPRMAVSAHLEGVMNGLLLVIVGLVWSHLGLSGRLAKIVFWLFAYAAFANWGVTTLAAALGTSRLTPMAGAGYSASPMQENVVQVIQVSLALAVIAAVALVVYSLRRRKEPG